MKIFKNSFLNDIPLPIRLFLGKALLFFVIWKLVYNVFLIDSKYLDHKLTSHVGESSVIVLNNSLKSMSGFTAVRELDSYTYQGEKVTNEITAIYHNEDKILNIANVCNGLELMILYIGFIVCMPSTFLRKLKYIVIGVAILDLVNIIRCVGLIYLREYFQVYFQFAHHYLFNAIIYTSTFIIWMYFSRKINLKNEVVQN